MAKPVPYLIRERNLELVVSLRRKGMVILPQRLTPFSPL